MRRGEDGEASGFGDEHGGDLTGNDRLEYARVNHALQGHPLSGRKKGNPRGQERERDLIFLI